MKASGLAAALERPTCLFCRRTRLPFRPQKSFIRNSLAPLTTSSRTYAIASSEPPASGADDLAVALAAPTSATQTRIEQGDKSALQNLRVVPASPAYFSGKPVYTDALLELQTLLRKYITLPVLPPGHAPRVAWKPLLQVRSMLGGEEIKAMRYHKIMRLLQRLNYIHPEMMPLEVANKLEEFKKDVQPHHIQKRPIVVDENGRARGVGRRKSSSAVAWLVEGEGDVLINGKTLAQFFGRLHDRESAIWALKATQRIDKYNVFALVKGGGFTGQAEALTLAVANALMVHEPALKPSLRRAGCVTRDPRRVERKKPGKLKARKMPAWVKR